MTTRSFSVNQTNESFKITLSLRNKKKRKDTKHYFQGYSSNSAAHKDIILIESHLDSGRQVSTFVKNVGRVTMEKVIKRPAVTDNKQYGCVAKATRKRIYRKYYLYCQKMKRGQFIPVSKSEWEANYNAIDTATGQRPERTLSRDPSTRYLYLSAMFESPLHQEKLKAIDQSIKYMNERTVTLRKLLSDGEKTLIKLRKAVYSSTCYSMLTKAIFTEDNENTTKEQLAKVTTQCLLDLSIFLKLNERASEEISMLRESLHDYEKKRESFDELEKAVVNS